jgi:hypothetical protein
MNNNYAYVTLLYPNDDNVVTYLDGAILMALGLRKQKTKYKIICMITKSVPQDVIKILEPLYDEIKVIDLISPKNNAEIKIDSEIFGKSNKYLDVFTKLHIFDSDKFPYKKVVFIDTDIIPLKKYDDLFNLNTPAGWPEQIAEIKYSHIKYDRYTRIWGIWDNIEHNEIIPKILTDIYKSPGTNINAGLMVIEPNKKIYDYFIEQLVINKKEWFGYNFLHKGCIDIDNKFIDYYVFPEQSYLTQHFSGMWHMIDGKYCAWGKHDENEIYGLHMAGLGYNINNTYKHLKTWMIQIPIKDGFNEISNKIAAWGIKKYPYLKNILYNNLHFYINNNLYSICQINEDKKLYNLLNNYQQKIINIKNN